MEMSLSFLEVGSGLKLVSETTSLGKYVDEFIRDNRGCVGARKTVEGGNGSNVPVLNEVEASNGLKYKSNSKHTLGGAGNRPNAGIEPSNSLELFENSITSNKKVGVRFTYDEQTNTLHRFFSDKNGEVWHWSGSTNQGINSLSSKDVPIDILRQYGISPKGW